MKHNRRGSLPACIAALTCVFLWGCAFKPAIPSNMPRSALSETHAIVIVSATSEFWDKISHSVYLNLFPAGEKKRALDAVAMNNDFVKSAFPDVRAQLAVFRVPAGRYKLEPRVMDKDPEEIRDAQGRVHGIQVSAGELIYAGELRLMLADGAPIAVFDQFERDVGLFKKLNPAFADVTVIRRLAELTDWP